MSTSRFVKIPEIICSIVRKMRPKNALRHLHKFDRDMTDP